MFQQIKNSTATLHYFLGEDKTLVYGYLEEIFKQASNDEHTLKFRTTEDIDYSVPTLSTEYLIIECVDAFLTPTQQRVIISRLMNKYPNAKIICGTNSPFVVQSVEGALVYKVNNKDKPEAKKVKIRKTGDTPRVVNPQASVALTEEQWKNIARQFPRCGWLIA